MNCPAMPINPENLNRAEKEVEIESQEIALPASNRDLVILAETLTNFEIPLNVLLQAMAIAAYDGAAAFRYADNYLNNLKNQHYLQNLLV